MFKNEYDMPSDLRDTIPKLSFNILLYLSCSIISSNNTSTNDVKHVDLILCCEIKNLGSNYKAWENKN